MTEQKLKDKLFGTLSILESIQGDATRASELTGAYVKDAIANLDLALGHVNDES